MKARTLALAISLGLTTLASCNSARGGGDGDDQFRTFIAALSGDQEVPPVDTDAAGTGSFTIDLDTGIMAYSVSFFDLSGPVTAAHFHVAPPGEAGGVIIDLSDDFLGDDDGFVQGTASFTAAQVADLNVGNVYINLHTEAHPDGEIRGKLTLAP